jgi:hypothetical protein
MCTAMSRPPRYTVQILLPHLVPVNPYSICSHLKTWRPDVDLVEAELFHTAITIPTADLPVLVDIFQAAPETYATALAEALRWTAPWPELDDALGRARASIVVSMAPERQLNHASMLLAFLAVLDTVLIELSDDMRAAAVLHWLPSLQVMSFERYRNLRTELGPCGPAVNVRLAAGAHPGEVLADTIGLAVLGLPDLQVSFHETQRSPEEVRLRLVLLARGLFVGDDIPCAWIEEESIAPPTRDALTLHLDQGDFG